MVKYIFKRILIGTGIALLLGLIRGKLLLNTYAMEVWPGNIGTQISVNSTLDTGVDFNNLGNVFSDQTGKNGYIYFNFSTYKISGSATDPVLIVRGASINVGDPRGAFICDIGSSSLQNSTFGGASYTAKCPVVINTGISSISIRFVDFQNNSNSTYRIVVTSSVTFEVQSNTSVSIDTSGTTSAINNQITNDNTNTQSIINNNNTNTQNIINNQNTNTQKEIDSQKVCQFIDKVNILTDNRYLTSSGAVTSSTNFGITDYISISKDTTITTITAFSNTTSSSLCFYNVNKSLISCISNNALSVNTDLLIPDTTSFVRFSINKTLNEPQFKICKNGNQSIVDSQNNINNTLNDDTGVSNSEITDLFGDLESSDTPISDLITMPLTLINAYIIGMSGNCQSITLGRLYGSLLVIPCINLESYLGSSLWDIIDIVCSLFLIYNISQLFITAFDSITSLKDNFSWLFCVEGKHVGTPSRVERNSDLY